MAVGQNQWYHFGVGAPPVLVYFSGDWDVHVGYGVLTHGHVVVVVQELILFCSEKDCHILTVCLKIYENWWDQAFPVGAMLGSTRA